MGVNWNTNAELGGISIACNCDVYNCDLNLCSGADLAVLKGGAKGAKKMEPEVETSPTTNFGFLVGFQPLYFVTSQKMIYFFLIKKLTFFLKGGANPCFAPFGVA